MELFYNMKFRHSPKMDDQAKAVESLKLIGPNQDINVHIDSSNDAIRTLC